VTSSVGWLGAVVVYLALAIVGWTGQDPSLVSAVYLAMELVALSVIVPLALASLLTGLLTAVVSPWDLFRHYWVVFKLLLNLLATFLLILYLPSIRTFAQVADRPVLSAADLQQLQDPTHTLHAAAAALLLLGATVLAVYKPRGLTRYGWRRQLQDSAPRASV
jgi:hypothetical protein